MSIYPNIFHNMQGKPMSPARPFGNFPLAEKDTSWYKQITNTKLKDEGDTIHLTKNCR